nr:14954_t:CDS:2 [Entrophospora candida]
MFPSSEYSNFITTEIPLPVSSFKSFPMTLEYPGITITLNISSNNDNERNALKETLAPSAGLFQNLANIYNEKNQICIRIFINLIIVNAVNIINNAGINNTTNKRFSSLFARNVPNEQLFNLPLPSTNNGIGKRIIETLLNESENVLNSPFNTKQEKDLANNHRSYSMIKNKKNTANDLIRSHTVVKREIRDVPSVGQGELEVKLLGSPNIRHAESYNCAAMLGKQYLLIGNDEGLSFMDFSVRYEVMKPIQIMRGIPFKKLQMLNDYGIMIAIAGKSQKIRIYRSSSLLHLIKFVLNSKPQVSVDFSKAPAFLKKFTDSGVKCEQCSKNADEGGGSLVSVNDKETKKKCDNCRKQQQQQPSSLLSHKKGSKSQDLPLIPSTTSTTTATFPSSSTSNQSNTTTGKFHQKSLSKNFSSHLTDFIQQQLSNSLEKADISSEEKLKVFQWASDYTKLTEISKDCMTFDVKETKSYLYLAVLSSNHVIYLFEYSLENNKDNNPLDIKFVHTQNYYIPETPCFINVLTGMYLIKHIIVGTNCSKAIMIDAHTSEVTEIYMKKNLIPRYTFIIITSFTTTTTTAIPTTIPTTIPTIITATTTTTKRSNISTSFANATTATTTTTAKYSI